MTVLTVPMSLEDFFAYTDTTDTLYELENGQPIEMPPESNLIHPSWRNWLLPRNSR
jgi:Uma2 family endonuclease